MLYFKLADMKLFEFDAHIGDWRVLIQDRDIQNGAVKSRHIANDAVTTVKIGDGEVKSRNIAPEAVTTDKIGDGEVMSRHIAPGAVTNDKIGDEAITGDEIEGDTVKNGKLANDAVQTRNIKDRNVTSPKIGKGAILPEHVSKHSFNEMAKDIQNQIDSLEISGVALSNEFGDNTHIGISQKTLTEAINKIWSKFEDITGEVLQGANMVVYPKFFISEDGCDVHFAANTADTNGIFEWIEFFVDGMSIHREENTHYVEPFTYHINPKPAPDYDYVIMCKAKIMGVEYTNIQCPTLQQIVTRYNEFYIGAGTDYTDIMPSCRQQLYGTMRHDYDITFSENGQKLIIVIGASLRDAFIRADLNGAEIEMTEVKLDAEGHVIPEEDTTTEVKFIGFMSEPWSAGDYNIDING